MDVRTTYGRLSGDVQVLLRPGRDLRVEVGPPGEVGLRLVGDVARLHLLARRCGAQLSVHDAAGCLAELAELAGLRLGGLGGEPGGQAEPGEQLRPDEVVDVPHPPA